MNAYKPSWECKKCGIIKDIKLYDSKMKKPGFKKGPVHPLCTKCGESVFPYETNLKFENKILVLTGPCGSGKTSISEFLYQNREYNSIDLDSLMDLMKEKYGVKSVDYNSQAVMNELEQAIEILMNYKKDIVLALIIDSDKLGRYKEFLENFNVQYKIVFLYSDYSTILKRTQTRTCFDKVTPEKWVRYFYDAMMPLKEVTSDNFETLDTTELTIEETVEHLLNC